MTVVPSEMTTELACILSNLVLPDNEIRSVAEKTLYERLLHAPETFILALAQSAVSASTETMRSFSLVLLRRFLFRRRPSASGQPSGQYSTLCGELSLETLRLLQGLLSHSLSHERSPSVRRSGIGVICELAKQGIERKHRWDALQAQVVSMAQMLGESKDAGGSRQAAFTVIAGCPDLVMDLEIDTVLVILQRGLQDQYCIEVRHDALLASISYLKAIVVPKFPECHTLVTSMFDCLHMLTSSVSSSPYPSTSSSSHSNYYYLRAFLNSFISLCSSHTFYFTPHLPILVSFLPALIRLPLGSKPTSMNVTPLRQHGNSGEDDYTNEEEIQMLRLCALEFMISLSESMPNKVTKIEGWVEVAIQCCMEGMAGYNEEEGTGPGLEAWLAADPSDTSDYDSPPFVFEHSLSRLTSAINGTTVLSSTFQHLPSMLRNDNWQVRHAGVMAVAATTCSSGEHVQSEHGEILGIILPLFDDLNPRVRYAAYRCVGLLCEYFDGVTEEKLCHMLFSVLVPALGATEPRLQVCVAEAIAALCNKLEWERLQPYLDVVVQGLLTLLGTRCLYVKEQVIDTLKNVADAGQHTFAKHYATVMPWLLDVIKNQNGADFKKLRTKAMECAGCVAAAVGIDVFRPDATILVELLLQIGNSGDQEMNDSLMATWANLCQAMDSEFEPYIQVTMPGLLATAGADADVSVYDTGEENRGERDGWHTVDVDGQELEIRTAGIEDKFHAFEVVSVYCTVLGPLLAPYMVHTLELCLSSLQFPFDHGVRVLSTTLIPKLLIIGKSSGLLTDQIISITLHRVVECIKTEPLASHVASLYQCLKLSIDATSSGGASILSQELRDIISDSAERQLIYMVARKETRKFGLTSGFMEENRGHTFVNRVQEDAVEEISQILVMLDDRHPLLAKVVMFQKGI